MLPPQRTPPSATSAKRRGHIGGTRRLPRMSYRTDKYFFISQSVSWTRYSSHSFRFSST